MSEPAELVERLVEAHGVSRVAVAYSGGIDSTALLHAAIDALGRDRVASVHVDHAMREGSALDARWCRDRASEIGVAFRLCRVEIGRSNRQADARSARYAALARASRALGAEAILTAHHADDAVETALERISRGAGLSGITGLREHLRIFDTDVLRPLLDLPKSSLRELLASRGIAWREDPTNRRTDYTRNAIRHDVIPLLAGERGGEALRRSVSNLRSEASVVERAVESLVAAATLPPPGRRAVRLDRRWLGTADDTLRHRAILSSLTDLGLPIEQVHLRAIDEARGQPGSTRVSVPNGFVVVSEATVTGYLQPRSDDVARPVRMTIEEEAGALPWFDHVLIWGPRTEGEQVAFVPGTSITIAGPIDGAKIAYEEGHKRVVDILRENDVSAEDRWAWPCIYRDGRCVAVVGLRAEPVDPGTRSIGWKLARRAR